VKVQTSSSSYGNAVVKIYKAGDTPRTPVWSYHIWVVNYTGGTTWTNNGFTFMDRNLGATDNKLNLASRGLLYQWGRKDPFPGGKSGIAGFAAFDKFYGIYQSGVGGTSSVTNSGADNAAAIVESIQKPTTFYSYKNSTYYDWLPTNDNNLWSTDGLKSGKKTIYDPCPENWRVPARIAISANNIDSPWGGVDLPKSWLISPDTEKDSGGIDWGANAKFPAVGRRRHDSGDISRMGEVCLYWSASPYIDKYTGSIGSGISDLYVYYNGSSYNMNNGSLRTNGQPVRCVKEK
jgi:hypothetical protein